MISSFFAQISIHGQVAIPESVIIRDLLWLLFLLGLSALCSASETAITALDDFKLQSLIQEKGDKSGIFSMVMKNRSRFIITLLIFNNITIIGATALTTDLFLGLLGESGPGIATAVMTVLLLVFGEITPKLIAIHNALPIFKFVVKPVYGLSILMTPALLFFDAISKWAIKVLRVKNQNHGESMQDLQLLIELLSRKGQLDLEKGQILHKALALDRLSARNLVKSRLDMQTIAHTASLEAVISLCLDTGFSRIPVQEDSKDQIVGIITLKMALLHHKLCGNVAVTEAMVAPVYIPETKRVADLLKEMLKQQLHLAIVVDEYGGTVGLITLEDVLEELVGEIYDESDVPRRLRK